MAEKKTDGLMKEFQAGANGKPILSKVSMDYARMRDEMARNKLLADKAAAVQAMLDDAAVYSPYVGQSGRLSERNPNEQFIPGGRDLHPNAIEAEAIDLGEITHKPGG